MRYILSLFILLLTISPAHAIDKKIGATNSFEVGVFDTSTASGGIAGLNLANTANLTGTVATNATTTLTGTSTTFLTDFAIGDTINVSGETVRTVATVASNTSLTVTAAFSTTAGSLTYTRGPRVVAKIQCANGSLTTVDTTGDTWVDKGGGYYWLSTNDSITNTNEDECTEWQEGAGALTDLITKTPVKFKAVGATIDAVTLASGAITDTATALSAVRKGSPLCDITAATSGISFTVSCTNSEGGAITLAADKWIGTIWRAYTNGGAACDVLDEKIRISAITSGGVVTAQNDTQFKAFTLTPNTSNCGIFNP